LRIDRLSTGCAKGATEEIVDRVFTRAKHSSTVLTEREILQIVNEASPADAARA